MGLVQEQNNTLAQVTRIYADPDVADPKTSSAILRQELARINTRLDQVGSLAESILQEQVTSVISADGLALGGQPVPPVWYHTTDLPLALIVSPRSVIRQDANISLLPEMNIEQIVALEEEVSKGLDVSALVTPVGGIGVYPTMITTTSNLDWLSEVIAHEWIHNYLTLRPLGMSFDKNEQLRTMNETTANLAGKEIGRQVLERYYPELLPAPVIEASAQTNSTEETTEAAPEFNFNQEMHGIRVKVDALLAAGKIEEAEKLMDNSRRRPNPDFVLNQPRYQGASVLLARKNFGCGSSREHAPWALQQYGFRAIIAPSFADIFFNNCYKSGLLPIVLTESQVDHLFNEVKAFPGFRLVVDLEQQRVSTSNGSLSYQFQIDPFRKYCLMNGLDDIGLTLRHADEIRAFEERHLASQPWLANVI
jgi:3-isopropylmalate/(R)-2-methylmalate dehydratase small subunit